MALFYGLLIMGALWFHFVDSSIWEPESGPWFFAALLIGGVLIFCHAVLYQAVKE